MRGSAAVLDLEALFGQRSPPAQQQGVGVLDLEDLFGEPATGPRRPSRVQEQPAPAWFHRRMGLPLYRLRLTPGERQALLCIVILGLDATGNALMRSLCAEAPPARLPSVEARKQAVRRAEASGELRMQRIPGTGDYDVLVAQRLIVPLRESLEEALELGPRRVFPTFRATEEQLEALYEALTPGGLRRASHSGGR